MVMAVIHFRAEVSHNFFEKGDVNGFKRHEFGINISRRDVSQMVSDKWFSLG